MTAPLMIFALLLSAVAAAARVRRTRLPARAVIARARESTVIARDGAVRSVQSAQLTLEANALERLWNPANLENLGRTYWLFLTRVTLGLIRVIYGEHTRSVVFIAKPLTLLRFDSPEYVLDGSHGAIRWRIRDGLLVTRSGRGSGYLALDVTRHPPQADGSAQVTIEVEVANFYPSIARGFSTPVYEMTQAAVHVLVTHAFLRSLAKLRLAQSKVGRLRGLL
jgi:hypothetical protein